MRHQEAGHFVIAFDACGSGKDQESNLDVLMHFLTPFSVNVNQYRPHPAL